MSDPVSVCEAVIERLTPVLSGWHFRLSEPAPPASVPLPYVLVEIAPTKGADYVQVDGDWAKWFVQVVLYTSAVDPEASLRAISPLVGTKGPICKALKDTMCDYDDALTALSNGVVQPTVLSGFKTVRKNRAWVRTATIAVSIGSN